MSDLPPLAGDQVERPRPFLLGATASPWSTADGRRAAPRSSTATGCVGEMRPAPAAPGRSRIEIIAGGLSDRRRTATRPDR